MSFFGALITSEIQWYLEVSAHSGKCKWLGLISPHVYTVYIIYIYMYHVMWDRTYIFQPTKHQALLGFATHLLGSLSRWISIIRAPSFRCDMSSIISPLSPWLILLSPMENPMEDPIESHQIWKKNMENPILSIRSHRKPHGKISPEWIPTQPAFRRTSRPKVFAAVSTELRKMAQAPWQLSSWGVFVVLRGRQWIYNDIHIIYI